ncbi:MAG: hypothetical protein Q6358_00640, partial [Candidatus Brocadiales bacterium]|nr:hypothetical protein [Candidatus Brocadiales bacterium]
MCIPVDINKFSLHSIYQNRLIRAFIGASRHNRNPNLFTGFDENDNLKMHTLRCRHKCRYENSCEYRKDKLFHVVNIALNLVKGDNPAWQERKAASFTITPLFSGCSNIPSVGYRNSEKYGGEDGISLGTAITVSGAAVSPNMGYHSSPVLSFLLTLFNIRLGLWMGNPADDTTFKKQGPILSLRPIISEAFGLTNEKKPYVYLSDGGHFENLGLYEMILRRCHFIVLVDAGCDEDHTFGDLGNALRKIRIDLGVPIVFKNIAIYPRKDEREDGKHCAIGNILYSKVDEKDTDGKLIYIKPTLCGDELIDIGSYAKANPEFPHESTGDQWFTESQFESYRALGSHAIYQICENTKTLTNLKDLFEQAEKYAIVSPKSPTENTTRVVITTSKT